MRERRGRNASSCHFAFASTSLPLDQPCSMSSSPAALAPPLLAFVHGAAAQPLVLASATSSTAAAQQHHASEGQGEKSPGGHWAAPPWLDPRRVAAKLPSLPRHTLRHSSAPDESHGALVAVEVTHNRRRVYSTQQSAGAAQQQQEPQQHHHHEGWDMEETVQTTQGRLDNLVRSYILPQGARRVGWRLLARHSDSAPAPPEEQVEKARAARAARKGRVRRHRQATEGDRSRETWMAGRGGQQRAEPP